MGVRWGLDSWWLLRCTPLSWSINPLSKPKYSLGNVEFADKIKIQSFRLFKLEHLIKEGFVILASRFAETKEFDLQRIQEFEVSIEDKECRRRTATSAPEDNLKILPLTREWFEN